METDRWFRGHRYDCWIYLSSERSIMKWNCVCSICDQWFESEYEDDNICPACHGEWLRNYQEESIHEAPEDILVGSKQ